MENSLNRSSVTPTKSRLSRTFAKVLHIRPKTTPIHQLQKLKSHEKPIDKFVNEEKIQNRASIDAFIAKIFATLSSIKAAYAQLQDAQSPYNADGIQSADQIVVTELKKLSEFKQSFLKKHIDDDASPETTILSSEIEEQRNLMKTYEITRKKLVTQSKVKDSEIVFLMQKLEEAERENKLIERRLNSSGPLSRNENLHFAKLTPTDFVLALKHGVKSVRSLVKFMVTEMEFANWDLDKAAESIQPEVVYVNKTDRCYAIESFVCREMFDGFSYPDFSTDTRKAKSRRLFFDRFMELKYLKAREYITWKPNSSFAKFCWFKYLRLVHPKMESSLFGNLNQRSLVSAGKFPETTFFESFAEVAKQVWLLHCLAFSIDSEGASMFQVRNGSRFSEVFMEAVNDEAFSSPERSQRWRSRWFRGLRWVKLLFNVKFTLVDPQLAGGGCGFGPMVLAFESEAALDNWCISVFSPYLSFPQFC